MRKGLAAIVGPECVIDDPAALSSYESDNSFAPRRAPWAVVRPGSDGEIQEIVAWANETRTPLVPASSGPPHFYGDTVPSATGAVIVDLTGMKKIRRIDRRNRIVVLEPGVTYPELQAALAGEGMRVMQPLLPRANKSVVGSLLERQPTLMPRYNFQLPEPLRSCGVVWGDGRTMFTGEAGAGPESLEDQWRVGLVQADAKGPAQTDFHRLLTGAQGTMGIVTWAAVRCHLTPAARKLLLAYASELGDLLDFTYRILRLRLGDEVLLLDRAYLARLAAAQGSPVAPSELPGWTLILGLGGREHYAAERVQIAEDDGRALASQCGIAITTALPGLPTGVVRDALDGCCDEPWKLAAKGDTIDIFFHSTLEKAVGYVATGREIAASLGFEAGDLGAYLQPQHQGVSCQVELSLPYDPTDCGETARARQLHDLAAERLITAGAYFDRPYGSWAWPVYNRDAASRDALRKVKRIFDPKGVMNPGKLCF